MRLTLILLALVLAMIPGAAAAEDRIALVIGNGDYSVGRLRNPRRDAELIRSKLEQAGFQVEVEPNATKARMQAAIDRFEDRIGKATPGATALFYYAGHGFAWEGINYLIPVDAEIRDGADLGREAVAIEAILAGMQRAGAPTKIMILDACRNTPLVARIKAPGQFVQSTRAPTGSFIAYSTGFGTFAQDGLGENSPYAKALAEQLLVPEQLITDAFTTVGIEVETITGSGEYRSPINLAGPPPEPQVPWISSSLRTKFKFKTWDVPEFVIFPATARQPRGVLARDFATVPTPTSGSGLIAAAGFLEDGAVPLTVVGVSPQGARVEFERNDPGLYGGKAVIHEISPNMLTLHGVNGGSGSFTLGLGRRARSISFKVPKLYADTSSGITFPAWKAQALSATGRVLDADARALGRSFTTIPSEIVTLRAPAGEEIAAIRFESDYRLYGQPFAAFEALLIEAIWVEPAQGAQSATLRPSPAPDQGPAGATLR